MSNSIPVTRRPAERPWWRRYGGTIGLTVVQGGVAAYIWLVNSVNTIPDRSDLVDLPVQVLRRNQFNPHLTVRLPDGSLKRMEFAMPISLGRNRYYGLTPQEEAHVVGCVGKVSGVNLRYVEFERFRVWAFDCGTVSLDFRRVAKTFEVSMWIAKEGYFGYLIGILLFGAFVFWVESRDTTKGK